ncbi:hypothetical protein ACQY0O_001052 [Thecaphora frezii]
MLRRASRCLQPSLTQSTLTNANLTAPSRPPSGTQCASRDPQCSCSRARSDAPQRRQFVSQTALHLPFSSHRGPLDQRIRHAFLQRSQSLPQPSRRTSTVTSSARPTGLPSSFFSSAPSEDGLAISHASFTTSSRAHPDPASIRHFLPEVLEPPSIYVGSQLDRLCRALRDRDVQSSWSAFEHLCASRAAPIPCDILLSLSTLIAQQPDGHNAVEIDNVCRTLLRIQEVVDSHPDGDGEIDTFSEQTVVASTRHCLLRTVYLLLLRMEGALASGPSQAKDMRHYLDALHGCLARLDRLLQQQGGRYAEFIGEAEADAELDLRARLAVCLVRHNFLDIAAGQLTALVRQARRFDRLEALNAEPFEQVLKACAAIISEPQQKATTYLPSPIDQGACASSTHFAAILEALRATLAADVFPLKSALHQALGSLDTATLHGLLPFELVNPIESNLIEHQAEVRFASRWHPWQSDTDGLAIPRHVIVSFADHVALVLAKRYDIAAALHIFESRTETAGSESDAYSPAVETGAQAGSQSASRLPEAPDLDLFVSVISVLLRRIKRAGGGREELDRTTYRFVLNHVRVVMRVYSSARRADVEIDAKLHTEVVQALSVLLRLSLVKIGNAEMVARTRDHTRAHLARLNEDIGSRQLLQTYLRRLTTSILSMDPTLRGGSLDLRTHASLLGLHMKVRDYSFSKRLYQLFRAREPFRNLWSEQKDSGSLRHIALDKTSAPDWSSFGWLFIESLTTSPRPHFATRLYLDWVGSGNTLTAEFNAMYVQALLKSGLRAVAERLLRDLHEQQVAVPASVIRTFVDKFAEAGYPEQAIEMALALTSAWVMQKLPSSQPGEGGAASLLDDSLVAVLEIYSIALDKASRARLGWTVERRVGLFKLFDEFRLGLGHLLRRNQIQSTKANAAGAAAVISMRYVRDAYNGAIRTHLEPYGDLTDAQDPLEEMHNHVDPAPGAGSTEVTPLITRQQIHKLVEEMKDLGVEPDSWTWTMLIMAELATAVGMRPSEGQLLRAVRIFETSTEATYLTEGPLTCGTPATAPNGAQLVIDQTRRRQVKAERKPVVLRSEAVGRLIIYLARGEKYGLANSVYAIWKKQQSLAFSAKTWDRGVEGARIYLLAAQGKSEEWHREIVKLTKNGYKPQPRFLRRLQAMDEAARATRKPKKSEKKLR